MDAMSYATICPVCPRYLQWFWEPSNIPLCDLPDARSGVSGRTSLETTHNQKPVPLLRRYCNGELQAKEVFCARGLDGSVTG
jgi:hypothetical protein